MFNRRFALFILIQVVEEKTEEELARQAARKEEATRRLREAAAKTRLDKVWQCCVVIEELIYGLVGK